MSVITESAFFKTSRNMSGITSSLPKVKAAAIMCGFWVCMVEKVNFINSETLAGSGIAEKVM